MPFEMKFAFNFGICATDAQVQKFLAGWFTSFNDTTVVPNRRVGRFSANQDGLFLKMDGGQYRSFVWHYKFSSSAIPGAGTWEEILQFREDTTSRIAVEMGDGGKIRMRRDGNGDWFASPTNVLTSGVYHTISLGMIIDNSAGELSCQVDGATVINETNLDTQAGGPPSYIDKVYIEGDGSDKIEFIAYGGSTDLDPLQLQGARAVVIKYPSGDASPQDWDSTQASLAAAIDGTIEETDYGSTNVDDEEGHVDMDDGTAGTAPVIVTLAAWADKSGAPGTGLALGIESVAAKNESAVFTMVEDTPDFYFHSVRLDPNTASAWSESGWNAAEGYVKRKAVA